jgi:hypothetical protein
MANYRKKITKREMKRKIKIRKPNQKDLKIRN